jgi:hypothetical protein
VNLKSVGLPALGKFDSPSSPHGERPSSGEITTQAHANEYRRVQGQQARDLPAPIRLKKESRDKTKIGEHDS